MIRFAVYSADGILPIDGLMASEELFRKVAFDIVYELRKSHRVEVALKIW